MANHITGIDHMVVAVQDLETARDVWQKLGFTITPRGRHRDMATGNYCIMFDARNYVELLGIVAPDQPDRGFATLVKERGEGLIKLAFSTDDVQAAAAQLRNHGIDADGPVELARPLELDGGEVEPQFRLVLLPSEAAPVINGFICFHVTPELTHQARWMDHENGVTGIKNITSVCDNPPELAATYETLLGAGATVLTDDTLTVFAGQTPLLFVTRDHLGVLYPPLIGQNIPREPHAVAMVLSVRSLDRTERHLTSVGIPFTKDTEGGIHVLPQYANGTHLVFEE